MSASCNCHHLSTEYEEYDGVDEYSSLCHGAECGRLVVFETGWESEDVWPWWLEAAIDHCGYDEQDADDLRFMFALGGIEAATGLMVELDRETCSTPGCQWW